MEKTGDSLGEFVRCPGYVTLPSGTEHHCSQGYFANLRDEFERVHVVHTGVVEAEVDGAVKEVDLMWTDAYTDANWKRSMQRGKS